MNRDFGTAFYGDPMNQDLRLNLPIESCLLQFVIKNKKMTEEEKVKMREKEEEVNEDEELDDLEDDYAYYYGEDEDDSSGSSEVTGFSSLSSTQSSNISTSSFSSLVLSDVTRCKTPLFTLSDFCEAAFILLNYTVLVLDFKIGDSTRGLHLALNKIT